ncbi:MAG: helix-turn-helix domain-containing protein, partial [Methanoregula sp.]
DWYCSPPLVLSSWIILSSRLIRSASVSWTVPSSGSLRFSWRLFDIISLEERIIQLLKTSGGEQYQSDIVKNLGLPKSTVSATLNDLHQRGVIQKIKKGRENLIRLT